MRVLMGVRCPGCGMTTSWSYYVRGQWLSSIQTNGGGFLLALLATGVIIQSARIGLRRPVDIQRQLSMLAIGLGAAISVAIAEWIWRLTQ